METPDPSAAPQDGFLPLRSRPLGILAVVLEEPPMTLGPTPYGHRKIVKVTGGSLAGPRLRAEVLPMGGDWAILRGDGVLMLDVRLTLRTHDGALVHLTYTGLRHMPEDSARRMARGEEVAPGDMYFRIVPVFETGDPRYDWLNRMVCVGVGERPRPGPRYHIHEIL